MTLHLHLNHARQIAMTGLTLTVCGTVLALHQQQVHAATDQVATPPTDQVATTTTTSQIQNNTPVTATTQQVAAAAQSNIQNTNADHGNYASLDQASISNGQLKISGWNANGNVTNQQYHTIIVLDHTTGHELGRQTVQSVQRPDVAKTYPNVANAKNAGWAASFNINSTAWLNHQLQIVSRYSFDQAATSGKADYWYAPITFNQNNEGHLDSWSFADGHFRASGWHATNASYQDRSHWIIVYDQTQHAELYRQKVSPLARPDVARANGGIYNSANAGWVLDHDFGNDHRWLNDQLQLISRYSSDDERGEGNHVDFWSNPFQADHTSRANLDRAAIANGKLSLTGWHASSAAEGRPYHTIIVLDAAGHEITRQAVTNTARPDVARVHAGLYNAANSGWSVAMPLKAAMVEGQIRIISRYSATAAANSNYTDYWFAPVSFNKNYAGITRITNHNGELTITGYHAADAAYGEPNHFLILFDTTANHQVAAVKTTAADTPAVAKNLNAYNAATAGFTANLTTGNGINSGHQYSLVLRYSTSADGNGSNGKCTDKWLPLTKTNQGHLETFNISNGHLTVGGWNANDFAVAAPNHFLLVYDNTAHTQVAAQLVADSAQRNDVARAYPQVITAAEAGFQADLGRVNLQPNHSYSIVSRYSTSNQGNGGTGAYQDMWLGPVTLNQAAMNVDRVNQNGNTLHVTGWLASDHRLNQPNGFVIALYNGREVGRQKINFTDRNDVARAYPQLYQSKNSGFAVDIPVNTSQLTNGQLSFILRLAASANGNSNYTDLRSRNYATNTGAASVSYNKAANTISINGWHAAMADANRPYQYLIVIGGDGHEFYRRQLNSTNSSQATRDGANHAGWVANAGQSGFSATLPVSAAMNHWGVKVIHRYTNDPAGNGNALDFVSPELSINSGFQRLNGGTVYYDPNRGQVATGWRTINNNRYYFSDGYENQPDPDDLWVYNDRLHGQMYTGINYVDGHCYDFGTNGIARALPQNDGWSWPFPASGEGYFAPGQAFGYSSYPRTNHYHDGLDFGAGDHPGAAVHAVHGGKVLDVNTCRNNQGQVMWWYIIAYDGHYLYVYQEAFSNRNQIAVNRGQIIYPGQVIGYRNTDHLHLGINTSPNYGVDLAHSFQPSWTDASKATGSGTWLDPEAVIRNRG